MNIEIGKIINAVGIKGHLKVKTYLSKSENIEKMGTVFFNEEKETININFIREQKGNAIISIKNIENRNQAESLIGKKIFIKRNQLPPLKKNEYYLWDIIGFEVRKPNGNKIGIIKHIKNFGAGDLIEVCSNNKNSFFLPINKENINKIDLKNKVIVSQPMKGIL